MVTPTTPATPSPFELCVPPSLALLVFRLSPTALGISEIEADKLNREMYDRINQRKDLMLTQTLLPGGVFCVRWAIGAESTRWVDVEEAWEVVRGVVEGMGVRVGRGEV